MLTGCNGVVCQAEVAIRVNRLKSYTFVSIVATLAFVSVTARAQSSISIKAGVSETVSLAVAPHLLLGQAFIDTASDRKTVTISCSGSGQRETTLRIPLLIRSNSGYVLSALTRTKAVSANVVITEARATGRFVASDALGRLDIVSVRPADLATPFSILRGTRISLAGTLDSPDNAVEVILLIDLRPEAKAETWQTQVTISASNSGRP